jgi:16S rRNA (adenine1518-N6/adenine1519-N6)-dimethyltransferase
VTDAAGSGRQGLPPPRKRFGQHFLHDRHVIGRIVAAVTLAAGERLVEIGPGRGAITHPLLERFGALTAIEFDRDLAAHWRAVAAGGANGLQLVEQDVLTVDWPAISGGTPLVVVGNLPYNIATAIIFDLIDTAAAVTDMLFMVQREVAERIAASPGSGAYGRLSVMVQQHCRVERVMVVGPGAFHPPPRVESAVVRLTPHPLEQRRETPLRLGEVVTAAFHSRRKTLRNTLRELVAGEQLEAAGIDPGARAETLAVDDFVRLARLLEPREGQRPKP